MLGRCAMLVRDIPGVPRMPVPGKPCTWRAGPGAQDPAAFPPGGGELAWQRGRIAEVAQLARQLEPDGLADVLGVGAARPVTAADRPDQPGS